LVLEKLPLLALVGVFSAVTLAAQKDMVMSLGKFPFDVRVKNALVAYVRYVGLLFWPSGLAVHYPHPGNSLPTGEVVGAAVFLAAVTGLVLWKGRRWPYLPVGWFWFLGTLVPVIGLVQLTTQSIANRFTYLPHIGLLLMVVWGAADLGRRWKCVEVVALGAAVLLAASALATWVEVLHWHDSGSLWGHALEVTRNNSTAHNHYGEYWLRVGEALQDRGHTAEARDCFRKAEKHFLAAVEIFPNYADAQYNLGLVFLYQDQFAEARGCFETALEINPDYANALVGLGVVLVEQGKPAAGLQPLQRALELNPALAAAYNGIGRCREMQGRLEEAVAAYRQAVQLQPRVSAFHCDLALALRRSGEARTAREEYGAAFTLNSTWPKVALARAEALATDPDPQRRNGHLAVRLALQVCQATDYQQAEALDVLAAAYAERKNFKKAKALARRALKLASPGGQTPLVKQLQARLRLYRRDRPARRPSSSD
jgi:tetratricopeptide (TPR) repeat protein